MCSDGSTLVNRCGRDDDDYDYDYDDYDDDDDDEDDFYDDDD